jgi:hypothetical protein
MTQETRRRVEAVRRLRAAMPDDAPEASVAIPEELRTPRFSRGIEHDPPTLEELHVGRFSEGAERLPEDASDKPHIGRFSEGIERGTPDPELDHIGRFSEGAEWAGGEEPPGSRAA